MKHHCPMCAEQWDEDVCAACGWREGREPRYTGWARPQQDVIELPDKHPLRIRAERAEAKLLAIEQERDALRTQLNRAGPAAQNATIADQLTAVIHQLRKHQRSHQSWLDHYIADPNHTCGRCTPEVLAGVGDAVEQEVSVKVYDGLIERVTQAQAVLRALTPRPTEDR